MKLKIEDEELKIELEGLEELWSLKRSLKIPLRHIAKATTEEPPRDWKRIRFPGTFIPGIIKAGTYYHWGRGKEFWYKKRGDRVLTIELKDEPYNRIVLGLDEAKEWAEKLNGEISRYQS